MWPDRRLVELFEIEHPIVRVAAIASVKPSGVLNMNIQEGHLRNLASA
jgi:hypothetical protein